MSSPSWYRSRLKSWVKPKVNKTRNCETCGVPFTVTPQGLLCFYCKRYDGEEDEG